MSDIAVISLSAGLRETADELGRSFSEFGFAIVRDHGIDEGLIAQGDALARAFFALPDAVKRAYHVPGGGGARGYTPFGVERAKDAQINDLKEFWHVGRSLDPGHEFSHYMPPNVWPKELPEFRDVFEALYLSFENAGLTILRAIALHLGRDSDFFTPAVKDGNSVMRLLHYPPLGGVERHGAIRAAAHGDINTITLLLGAEESGLELLTRANEWKAVEVPKGALVINVGDMLDRLTRSYLRSTLHRVVNPVGEAAQRSRYSMPFFLHFRPDYIIEPMVDIGTNDPAPPISSHDFLMQRLREINLT